MQLLLEDVVTYIISAGGATMRHIDSNMLLVDFVRDVLLLSEDVWKEVYIVILAQNVIVV